MEIKINVPENCEPAMVTVVYKFHRGIAEMVEEAIEKPAPRIEREHEPVEAKKASTEKFLCSKCHEEFDSKRSCGQHERHCGKSKRGKGDHWTPEQIQYLIDHQGKQPHSEVAEHLGMTKGQCWDKWYYLKKTGRVPETITAKKAKKPAKKETTNPLDETMQAEGETIPDAQEKKSPWRGAVEKIDQLFSKKEFQVPADFNPSKPFGVNSYVYHAPAREMGKVVTVDMQSKTVLVDFNGTAKKFTLDAAREMHAEMIVRAR